MVTSRLVEVERASDFLRFLTFAPVDIDPEELRAVQPLQVVRQIVEVIDLVAVEQHGAHCVGFLLTGASYPRLRALKRNAQLEGAIGIGRPLGVD